MEKIDFKRRLKHLYSPSNKVINIVDVPEMKFLSIDSYRDTEFNNFQEASETLARLSYTIKFIIKRSNLVIDYISMPLECLWCNSDKRMINIENKNSHGWTLCIMQPEFITEEVVKEGIERTKKKKASSYLEKVRLNSFKEGISLQIMHIGQYEEENETIDKIQAYLDVNGYELCGKYHEIYLGDPRRARPENLKTIIRQPIKGIKS